jgi:hypothetical protein
MPDNKTKLFFETRQVFIAYISKQILPFAFRQGIITSSDTKTTGQPLLQAEAKKPFSQALHPAYESSFWKVSFFHERNCDQAFPALLPPDDGSVDPDRQRLFPRHRV